MKDISVLIVTYGRAAKLRGLLESLVRFAGDDKVEIIIYINGQDRRAEDLLLEFVSQHSNIRYIVSSGINRAEARNLLIKDSQGEIVYFLDDDVRVEKDVISLIRDKFRQYADISILGGPNLNAKGCSLFQESQGLALGSFFGSLWVSQRYRKFGRDRRVDESALILCNLAARRGIFAKENMYFSGNLISAEENLLLARLSRLGYKAMHIPELEVFHERRATYKEFFRQIVTYGKGRAQIFKIFPEYINPVYFLPMILVFCVAAAPFIKYPLYSKALLAYPILDALFSLNISLRDKDLRKLLFLLWIFPTIHFAYALGFMREIFSRRKPY